MHLQTVFHFLDPMELSVIANSERSFSGLEI